MIDDLIALAGDLVFERKRLSESLRRLEGAFLRGENTSELMRSMGVRSTEELHAELEILARGLDRIGALTKTLVHQVNHDRLVDADPLLKEAAERLEQSAAKFAKPVTVECRAHEAKVDRSTVARFRPILFAMLDVLVEFCVEPAKERAARKKRSKAYFQIEIKSTEDGYRLMVVCDGNGILPPLSHDHGLQLATIGVRAGFEGKPGQWSAWIFHLPIGFGSFNCVYVKCQGRKFCIPALAVSKVASTSVDFWTIDKAVTKAKFDGDSKSVNSIDVVAGTKHATYCFEAISATDEVFMKPLSPSFNGNGRFLGVVAIEGGQGINELCLVLNPAYLVYGDEALLDAAREDLHAI